MKKIALVFLTLLLIGCSTPVNTSAVVATISPTVNAGTLIPTGTSIPSEVPTENYSGQFSVKEECPVVEDKGLADFSIVGTPVLITSKYPYIISMLTPSLDSVVQIADPNIQLGAGSVSPDGKVLAYSTGGWKKGAIELLFSDKRNNVVKTIPWNDEWYLIGGWVNKSQLAILAYEQKLVLVSPYSDQQETVSTLHMGFPDYSTYNLGRPWVLFSPNMKRAVFSNYFEEILFDVENRKEIFVIPRYGYELAEAAWSNNGSSVAMVGQGQKFIGNNQSSREEIYALTQDGSIMQVTDFADFYYGGVLIYHPSWSPDGSSIAFWIYSESYTDAYYRLAILKLKTNEATVYCLSSDLSRGIHVNWYATPVWSPDSRQIMIEIHHGEADNSVVVLDTLTDDAMKISEDSQPVGWMVP